MSGHKSESEEKIPRAVTKFTELLAEKHKFLDRREFETGKLLQKTGCEERKTAEHSRETFLMAVRRNLIPLRRAIEMNPDDLLGVGDVVPVPVGLPAFGDNLNEYATDRRLWNMGDALQVGLDVDFRLFVFD
jgi:hypothetical protein